MTTALIYPSRQQINDDIYRLTKLAMDTYSTTMEDVTLTEGDFRVTVAKEGGRHVGQHTYIYIQVDKNMPGTRRKYYVKVMCKLGTPSYFINTRGMGIIQDLVDSFLGQFEFAI